MGRTSTLEAAPFRILSRNGERCDEPDGAISRSGTTIGTMLHGIFENERLRRAMLASLRRRRGLVQREGPAIASREAEYDRLAAAVRSAVDIARIRQIAGI